MVLYDACRKKLSSNSYVVGIEYFDTASVRNLSRWHLNILPSSIGGNSNKIPLLLFNDLFFGTVHNFTKKFISVLK